MASLAALSTSDRGGGIGGGALPLARRERMWRLTSDAEMSLPQFITAAGGSGGDGLAVIDGCFGVGKLT